MKTYKMCCICFAFLFASSVMAQTANSPSASSPAQTPAARQDDKTPQTSNEDSARAQAYYDYTMGHILEQEYENSSQAEDASKAIEFYKKAYEMDPKSPVIGGRLAEMYWKAQRVPEAEAEAKAILKRNPDDVATHKLLGHIYLRALGNQVVGAGQSAQADRAIEQFREVVRLDPTDSESALWLEKLYRVENKHDEAEAVLRGILKSEPDNESAVEQLTQLLLDEGKSAEAVTLLQGILAKSPSATLLDLLGDAYTQTKDFAKAEDAYRKAVDMDPSEVTHYRGLGQTLMSEEKYPEALEIYKKLIDLMPDDADNYLRAAQIYREMREMDKAEESLIKARQYAPGSLEVLYNQALLYEAEGRFEDAIKVLSDAATNVRDQSGTLPSRRRTLAVIYQQLGQLYRENQNYSAAVNTYQELGKLGDEEDRRSRLLLMDTYRTSKDLPRALQVGKDSYTKYPSDPSIKASYALLLGENGQTDEAVKMLRPQLNGTASDRETYLNIAQIYERGRHYKEAEDAARAAESVSGSPDANEMAWFLLGAIYERQKQFDKAEAEFKKVLNVNPKNAAALNYYGYMLGDLGLRLDEAQILVQRALNEDPYNGAYLDSLGWIYFKENKLQDAETTLRKAVERESHDPTIHSHLGDVYSKLGRTDMAAAEWEKSLQEWKHVLPADVEDDKIAEIEKRISQVKHRVAQKAPSEEIKQQ